MVRWTYHSLRQYLAEPMIVQDNSDEGRRDRAACGDAEHWNPARPCGRVGGVGGGKLTSRTRRIMEAEAIPIKGAANPP